MPRIDWGIKFGDVLIVVGMFIAGLLAYGDAKSDIVVNATQIRNLKEVMQEDRRSIQHEVALVRATLSRIEDKLDKKSDK